MSTDPRLKALIESDPTAARKLFEKLAGKTLVPHSGGQIQVMEATERFQILVAGRRTGKSSIGAKRILRESRKHNKLSWWISPTYKVVKRGYNEVLRQLPDGLLSHTPSQDSAFDAGRSVVLKFKNGSRIEFYSAEREAGMLGAGVDFAVLDEAAMMRKPVWEQIIRPTLMDRQGSALMISTPRGRNWLYYLWLRGQNPEHKEYKSWQFPTSANPYIADSEIEEMRESMPKAIFEQEVLALFISSAGSVFRFNDEIVMDHVKPQGHVVVGVDLAKSQDYTVFSAANSDSAFPCGFERMNEVSWPMQRNRLKQFCRDLHKDGATHVTLMIDQAGPGDPFVDEMEADGYDVVGINFTSKKQHMVMQLAKDLEDGIARLGPEHLDEFENYSYKVTDSGRFTYSAPEGQHDDCVSAKMLQHWGIVQAGAPDITSISVDDTEDAVEPSMDGEYAIEDYSDLFDPEIVDTGQPKTKTIRPDSTAMIMARESAWH